MAHASSMKMAATIILAILCIQPAPTDAFVAPAGSERRGKNIILHSTEKSAAPVSIYDGISINDKVVLRDPTLEERGKGGVSASADINALEVLARIPRTHCLASVDEMSPATVEAVAGANNITWATELTAVALELLHTASNEDYSDTKRSWVQSWEAGGWGAPSDLGPDISNDIVGPSVLTTGSGNDHNIYAKFRMPCHPALFKASMGLKLLTTCTEDDARKALYARGDAYRSMRDALQPLVETSTTQHDKSIKGTLRDKRCWDVADTLSKVISRATTLTIEDEDCAAIVPIHERLSHSLNGGNTKLVSIESEVLLVATRDIDSGEGITRDYTLAPRLENDESTVVGSALHLLLQFGLPPHAFPKAE